jgi:hypothetical protein
LFERPVTFLRQSQRDARKVATERFVEGIEAKGAG